MQAQRQTTGPRLMFPFQDACFFYLLHSGKQHHSQVAIVILALWMQASMHVAAAQPVQGLQPGTGQGFLKIQQQARSIQSQYDLGHGLQLKFSHETFCGEQPAHIGAVDKIAIPTNPSATGSHSGAPRADNRLTKAG
jgi:hypothetical protein